MNEIVDPFDFSRMFWGDQSVWFYAEIVLRTSVIYLYFFLLLRWIGRRAKSGLSLIEVILIVALGSAVGDGTFYPQVPLAHALLVITLVVLTNRGAQYFIQQHEPFRHWVEGKPLVVLRDGVLVSDSIERAGFEEHDIREMLRGEGICNLGQVRLAIIEPSSRLSLFLADDPMAGLSILPEEAEGMHGEPVGESCCNNCGTPWTQPSDKDCQVCGTGEKTEARRPEFDYP